MLKLHHIPHTSSAVKGVMEISLLIMTLLVAFLPATSAAETSVRDVLMPKSQHAASAEWYCNAGACDGDDGRTYHCGYILCGGQIDECGCTCVSVSNAPYPKGFCGTDNPYPNTVTRADAPRRIGPIPFNLY